MRKLLIVSPYFPPGNAPDMQRIRMSLPHYRSHGWEPVVLAVDAEGQEGAREPDLVGTVPADVRVVRARALPSRWTRRVGVHNLGLRALGHLRRAGARLLAAERFDAVFISNTQFVTFLLGPAWKRRFGVPYVLDVQDPWRTDYYERPGSRPPPGGWKYRFARLQARLFEGHCFRNASAIMSVSPAYLDDLRGRYPKLAATPSAVLRFGVSEADFAQAGAGRPASPPFRRDAGQRHLVYTGAAGPVMPHALLVLFEALRRYAAASPERARRLRLHFIGSSYAAPGRARPSVLPIAEASGVADWIEEIPHRVGFLEALRLQRAADALLLLGSSDRAYSPSKVYNYYLSGPPILGVVFPNSVMERLLEELSCAFLVRFDESGLRDAACAAIARFFDGVLDGFAPGELPTRDVAAFNARYSAAELTRQQCLLFDRAVGAAPA